MSVTPDKPGPSPRNPFLELKSERVQAVLPHLSGWEPHLGGLEATFHFEDGNVAFAFLLHLGNLLERHPEPPSRLTLTGPILSIGLGLGNQSDGVHAADLALAGRITALRNVVSAKPRNPPRRPRR